MTKLQKYHYFAALIKEFLIYQKTCPDKNSGTVIAIFICYSSYPQFKFREIYRKYCLVQFFTPSGSGKHCCIYAIRPDLKSFSRLKHIVPAVAVGGAKLLSFSLPGEVMEQEERKKKQEKKKQKRRLKL
ncbi:MAG: hypothetical protein ACOY40_18600 [Bacillota bacterium]